MIADLWRYRRFVLGMVRREFRARYRGSLLGSAWAILQPLATIVIYTLVFGTMLGGRLPGRGDGLSYGLFLCAGVLTWASFTEILQRCTGIFVAEGNLMKKMAFPRVVLPTVVWLSATLHLVITLALLVALLLVCGRFPGPVLLVLVPLVLLQQAIGIGLGVALGILNVFFRDIGHGLGIVVQYWFWLTPIVYPAAIVPAWARPLVELNPMTGIVVALQTVVLEGRLPEATSLIVPGLAALASLTLGRVVFRRFAGEMTDEL